MSLRHLGILKLQREWFAGLVLNLMTDLLTIAASKYTIAQQRSVHKANRNLGIHGARQGAEISVTRAKVPWPLQLMQQKGCFSCLKS